MQGESTDDSGLLGPPVTQDETGELQLPAFEDVELVFSDEDLEEQASSEESTAEAGDAPWRRADTDARREQRQRDAELIERIRLNHDERQREAYRKLREIQEAEELFGDYVDELPKLRDVPFEPCPEYQVLADRLFRYAVKVLKSKLRTGQVRQILVDREIEGTFSYLDLMRLHTSLEARDHLAVGLIIAGEETFRRYVIPNGKWQADGGASLETYFVNGCLMQLRHVLRQWHQEHDPWFRKVNSGDILAVVDAQRLPDHAEQIANRALLSELIDRAPSNVKRIIGLLAEGLSAVDVATELGMSARAVEGAMYRFRTKLRQDADRGALGMPMPLFRYKHLVVAA